MSHSRTKPAGWAVNEKLTSAQINDIDIKTRDSVDKTTAGDTIEGPISLASGASISALSGSDINVDSGASLLVAGTAVVTGVGAKLSTASSGRIEHGDNDYPLLASGHSGRNLVRYYSFGALPRIGDSNADIGLIGMTLAAAETAAFILPVPHHGATLSEVEIRFVPDAAHASGGTLPGTNITMTLIRRSNAVGGTQTSVSLLAAGTASYTPVSAPDYGNGLIKALTMTCDQNNTIDRTQYSYDLTITNESGANSLATLFVALVLRFSSITDLRIG